MFRDFGWRRSLGWIAVLAKFMALAGCERDRDRAKAPDAAQTIAPAPSEPAAAPAGGPFTVLVYNVENLFDLDPVAHFPDYRPEAGYGPRALFAKLDGIRRVLAQVNEGQGPEVILFQEIEIDFTPNPRSTGPDRFAPFQGRTARAWLTSGAPLPDALADAPAVLWLERHLLDEGLPPYHIVVAETFDQEPGEHRVVHSNAVFSRFPIRSTRTHPLRDARGILEADLDVAGRSLVVFNNHWKSGAGDLENERIRVANAAVLRARLDALLREDPRRDIVMGGDFNTNYNQDALSGGLLRTGLHAVLGSQGDESAVRRDNGPDVFNLWFELPEAERGSDVFKGRWGTLMHLMVTRGLMDQRHVQYVDNSFARLAVRGLNADPAVGTPVRWNGESGFSDHFPVLARFRVVNEDTASDGFLSTPVSSRSAQGPDAEVWVDYEAIDPDGVTDLTSWDRLKPLLHESHRGRFFLVAAEVKATDPVRLSVSGAAEPVGLWAHPDRFRKRLMAQLRRGQRLRFYGELARHPREGWQFVIHHPSWLLD